MGRPITIQRRLLADFPPGNPEYEPVPGSRVNCLLWQGACDRDGYGILNDRGKRTSNNHQARIRAHRWVWEQANGPIPPGLVVRHRCDNPPCYRLSHLELGTVADNVRDAQQRGHLGPVRSVAPSEVRAIQARHEAGESYARIAKDFPQYSLSTIKRTKEYINDID